MHSLLSYIVRIIGNEQCVQIYQFQQIQSNVNGYFVDYPNLAVIKECNYGTFYRREIIYIEVYCFGFFSKYGELCAVIVDRIFVWNNAYVFFIWKRKYTTIFVSMVRLFLSGNTF